MEKAESEILLPARSASPTPVLEPSRELGGQVPGVCSLCLSEPARYTCPRCNAPYCSLGCYRGPRHETCSESFYREAVMEVLREEQAGPRGRREVEEMLLKMKKEEEAMEEPGAGLDGTPEVEGEVAGLWNSLTPQEKKDFHRLLQSGNIGALVPEWKPWWDTQETSSSHNHKISALPAVISEFSCPEEPKNINEKLRTVPDTTQEEQPGDNKGITLRITEVLGYEEECPAKHQKGPETDGQNKRLPLVKNDLTYSQEELDKQSKKKLSGLRHLKEDHEMYNPNITERPSLNIDKISNGQDGQETEKLKTTMSPPVTREKDEKKSAVTILRQTVDKKHDHKAAHLGQGKDGVSKDTKISWSDTRARADAMTQPILSKVPPPFKSIPSLHSLSRNPSPLVKYSLVNAIYGYAFSLQRHNGDLSEDDSTIDFTGMVLIVSGALNSAAVYNSTAHALQSAVRLASDPQHGGDDVGACKAIEATSSILMGDGSSQYTLAALAHLSRVLGRTRKLAAEGEVGRKAAFNAKKKCLFLAAWVNENGNMLAVLSKEARMEHIQHLSYIKGINEIAKGLQKSWGGKRPPEKKKLIEEVDVAQI
ncbi:zinc finger HIT domain-containing protein 2 [Discoglossus pictus]